MTLNNRKIHSDTTYKSESQWRDIRREVQGKVARIVYREELIDDEAGEAV